MILSFYDKDFKAIANNTALVIDKKNYSLIKRPIELNTFSCVCETFTEDVQPTFLIVKDDIGRNIIYSALAGVPQITTAKKTNITGTDLKAILSSDVILQYGNYTEDNTIGDVFGYVFNQWNTQVNQGTFSCKIIYKDNANNIKLTTVLPTAEMAIYNALEEIQSYLKAYDLYIDTNLDLQQKQIIFTIGKTMLDSDVVKIKTWEYNVLNFGKWIADINETQGYYNNNGTFTAGTKWILTSNNEITNDVTKRDIYPIKRQIYENTESLLEAEKDAIIGLLDSRYNENLEISVMDFEPTFSTSFDVSIKKNNIPIFYKRLPCGELRYNYNGLYEVQIGFRYTGVDFI